MGENLIATSQILSKNNSVLLIQFYKFYYEIFLHFIFFISSKL